ncbi:Glycosyl hydrolase catalytic core domain containing protein [Rhypophila decipiens]
MKAAIQTIAAFAALAAAAPAPITIPAPALSEDSKNATIFARGTDAPFGIKKGVAFNNPDAAQILSRPNSATWSYNWGGVTNAPAFQQIPMCHGPGWDCDSDRILRRIAENRDTPYVLGYNEPDFPRGYGGVEASPQAAYDNWGNDMFKFNDRGAKLVCPAISSYNTKNGFMGYESGLQWLRKFASIGNNPSQFRCSAQAIHWYGWDGESIQDQAKSFMKYVEEAHREVNDIFRKEMPLWITEFAPEPRNHADKANRMAQFLNIVVPWLDRQDYVHRYAPFWAEDMVDLGSRQPNAAGWAFVNARG